MKKILGVLLGLCFMFLPMFVNAETKQKVDISKYNTMNFTETLADEEIELKYTDYKESDDQVTIYLFRGKGCGYCRSFLNFLNDNAEEYGKYFKVVSFESWYDEDNSNLLDNISSYLGQPAQGVPFIIIGDQVYPGYASSYDDSIKSNLTALYEAQEDYDVFEDYNESIDAENKAANASTNKVIIWNFIFVLVATTVVVLSVKKAEKNILASLSNSKKVKEVANSDEPSKPKKAPAKKATTKKKNAKK